MSWKACFIIVIFIIVIITGAHSCSDKGCPGSQRLTCIKIADLLSAMVDWYVAQL